MFNIKTNKMKKESKGWVNHKGETVPEKYVSNYDKKKEKLIAKLAKKADALNEKLTELKKEMFADADLLDNLMYKEHSMERSDASKGNFTMYSFNKELRMSVKVADVIEFSDLIKLAQEKIQQFIESKSKDADQDLMVLVNNAFKTTKGRLDKARVFSLFNYEIKHPLWIEAIDLIKKSITTNHTKRYVVIAKRDNNGEYTDINLNFSSL